MPGRFVDVLFWMIFSRLSFKLVTWAYVCPNHNKSDVICKDTRMINAFLSEVQGMSVVDPNLSILLGSLIGSSEGVDL